MAKSACSRRTRRVVTHGHWRKCVGVSAFPVDQHTPASRIRSCEHTPGDILTGVALHLQSHPQCSFSVFLKLCLAMPTYSVYICSVDIRSLFWRGIACLL